MSPTGSAVATSAATGPTGSPATDGSTDPDRASGADADRADPDRPEELDEPTLVARAQDGDLLAFERLVERYQRPLFGLAMRMLADRGDAEDVVQDTLVTAWRRLPLLTSPGAFGGWVYRVATNRSLDLLRSRSARRTDPTGQELFDASASDEPGPGEAARLSAEQADLRRLIGALTPEQRACWLLYEVHGRRYAEIAAILGTSETAVRGRIARARQQLAEGMEPWR